ncbi:Calpain-9 [Chelonia mydas]|uniref:Calpain-9 n=1 Tax=Chelonia mydas TaxID=8469 RepID=M7AZA5_CHEMY|nr:Calpain-9 [Chelonia mydas]
MTLIRERFAAACDPFSELDPSEKPPIPFVWKRPGEIVKNPQFITGGATRTDICQGDLGDCWLLAAIASLTLKEKTLARVVPQDQNFGPGYAGIFHFQFWQHNEWLDIVIDDRLPTFKDRLVFLHSSEHNEFWSALLEKAYAKLNGSYEALKGGSTLEAMEDFTGGVGEMYEVKKAPENFYEILGKALERGSLVGCSIDTSSAAESEARTPFGLIKGHAYSVTGIDEVSYRGRKVQLVRPRNPWGQVEWNGRWSDNSPEWQSVSPSEQKRLCQTVLDDGEFWYGTPLKNKYADENQYSLKADPFTASDVPVDPSYVLLHIGLSVRFLVYTFWTNPQIRLHLTEKDDGNDECTFIAALMQKNRRKLRKLGAEMLTIGYAIYESPSKDGHLNKDFFRYHPSKARSKTYINLREVSDRVKLPPGDYVIVPSTFEPHQEADFCLRIFSEKKAITENVDGNIDINLPEPPKPTTPQQETEEEKQFRALFEQVAGEDMEITAEELEYVLNAVLKKTNTIAFEKGVYLKFDSDKSGTMSSYELRSALTAAGFQLNNYLLQLIVLRYSDDQFRIDFDDFLNCLIRLENANRASLPSLSESMDPALLFCYEHKAIRSRGGSTNFAAPKQSPLNCRRAQKSSRAAAQKPPWRQERWSCRRIAAAGHGLPPHSECRPKHLLGKLVPGAGPDKKNSMWG